MYWAAEAATKGVELLRRFLREVEHPSIECVILKILKERPMILVRATSCGKRYVAHLGELSIVIEGCNFQLCNSFRRRIRVCTCSAIEDVRCRDTINRESNHGSMLHRRLRYCPGYPSARSERSPVLKADLWSKHGSSAAIDRYLPMYLFESPITPFSVLIWAASDVTSTELACAAIVSVRVYRRSSLGR